MKAREIKLKRLQRIGPFSNKNDGDQAFFNYREQLWAILKNPSEKGFLTTAEVLERARIQLLLETVEDGASVILTDEQYAILNKCIQETRWTTTDRFIADMIEDVNNAASVELEKKDPS
jgi:hypothetical protein